MLKKKENQNHMPKLKRAEAEWIRDALLSRFESQIRARLDDIKVYGDKYDFGIIVFPSIWLSNGKLKSFPSSGIWEIFIFSFSFFSFTNFITSFLFSQFLN